MGGEIVARVRSRAEPGAAGAGQEARTRRREITAIVGQGPHIVQPIARINGKPVVFSEGNLISNQGADAGLPAASQDGMVVLLDCVTQSGKTRVTGFVTMPVFVSQPDYTVLPIGSGLKKGQGDETLLRDSYQRTVSVVGRSKKHPADTEEAPGG